MNQTPSPDDLEALLNFGGFPEPFFARSEREWKRLQREQLSRVIHEDRVSLEQVWEAGQLDLLAVLLQDRVASLLSLNFLREDLSASYEAADRWVRILENLYCCVILRPLAANRIKALKKDKTLYPWD
ncbi:MAG: ATP-binding protein [Candidatus Electrothrix sp. AR4]|nr:ATP-binding protein [Candidatus Electrothrix sp. AR4]